MIKQNGFLITEYYIILFYRQTVHYVHVYFAEQLLFIFRCISWQQNVLPATAIKIFNKCIRYGYTYTSMYS